ncbi:MAG: hypothetical protein WCP12_01655 [bacterium]
MSEESTYLLQMLAGVGEPVLKNGTEVGGFETGRGDLVEGVPLEADPVLCGGERLVRGDSVDGEFEDQVDFRFRLAVLDEGMLTTAKEASGLGGVAELLLNFAHKSLATGFTEINVSARQVGDSGFASIAEQKLIVHYAGATCDHFNGVRVCHDLKI